jgi:hypothetical protein
MNTPEIIRKFNRYDDIYLLKYYYRDSLTDQEIYAIGRLLQRRKIFDRENNLIREDFKEYCDSLGKSSSQLGYAFNIGDTVHFKMNKNVKKFNLANQITSGTIIKIKEEIKTKDYWIKLVDYDIMTQKRQTELLKYNKPSNKDYDI